MHKKKMLALGLLLSIVTVAGAYVGGSALQGKFSIKDSLKKYDLTVVSITEEDDFMAVTIGNLGASSVPSKSASSGYTYVYIDDMTNAVWKYKWSDLEDLAFLNSKGTATLEIGWTEDYEHEVKVCVDATSILTETDETNNCLTVNVQKPISE